MNSKLPALLSSKQVAEMIGIHRKNMQQKRKTKGFPEPVVIVDGFPIWLESDVLDWMRGKLFLKEQKQ
jgi:predicted DNA-binding transcriptional regulator AlpA